MKLRDYNPLRDAAPAYEFWQTSGHFPMDPVVFTRYVSGRESYRPGDAIVAESNDRPIGFGVLEVHRRGGSAKDASIILVLVHADDRRHGVGSAIVRELERRLRNQGLRQVAAGGWFWPGIPDIPTGSIAFFESLGFEMGEEMFDLVIPLDGITLSKKSQGRLSVVGAEIDTLTADTLTATIDYQRREFPWWVDPLMDMLPYGMDDVLIVRRGEEVIGSTLVFTPHSRSIVAGLQRQSEFGTGIGALGAVGIANEWRGQGLGMAMCEAAAEHIRGTGATHIYVEEVEKHIVPFYRKMGGELHGRSIVASKRLGKDP